MRRCELLVVTYLGWPAQLWVPVIASAASRNNCGTTLILLRQKRSVRATSETSTTFTYHKQSCEA